MYVRSVVSVLQTLALPQVALGWVVVRLSCYDLLKALDVAIDAPLHVVVGLLAACGFESGSRWSACGGGEVAVGIGESHEAGSREEGCGEMHGVRWDVTVRAIGTRKGRLGFESYLCSAVEWNV